MESSQTRDQTCVPCIGRRIPNHFTTREVQMSFLILLRRMMAAGPTGLDSKMWITNTRQECSLIQSLIKCWCEKPLPPAGHAEKVAARLTSTSGPVCAQGPWVANCFTVYPHLWAADSSLQGKWPEAAFCVTRTGDLPMRLHCHVKSAQNETPLISTVCSSFSTCLSFYASLDPNTLLGKTCRVGESIMDY